MTPDDLNFSKKWNIYSATLISETMGTESLTKLPIKELTPQTHNKSQLMLTPRSLPYGIYKLRFFVRMLDLKDEDPYLTRILPFQSDIETYIEIVASPLVAGIVEGKRNIRF